MALLTNQTLNMLYRPRGHKTLFMLNLTEHEIQLPINTKIPPNKDVSCFKSLISDVVFIMLINVKMPTIVGIVTLMNRLNFVLS